MNKLLEVLSGTFAEAEAKDFSQPLDEGECAEDYGYHSDSDLEEDTAEGVKGAPPSGHPLGEGTTTSKYRVGTGRIIKIQDVAFITCVPSETRPSHHLKNLGRFQAFLCYLYTGFVKFAPYGSEENRRSRGTELVLLSHDSVPRPSPKSIYRLADKVHSYHFPIDGTLMRTL